MTALSPSPGLTKSPKLFPAWRIERDKPMQRNMDLVLAILEQTEQRVECEPKKVEIEGFDELSIGQHVELLFSAGYLTGHDYDFSETPFRFIAVRDLTWQGHEFLAVLRNAHGWGALKKALPISELSKMPLKLIQEIGTAALKSYAMNKLGLSE